MSASQLPQVSPDAEHGDMFLHLKEIIVTFDGDRRPKSDILVKFKDRGSGFVIASKVFKKTDEVLWEADVYVKANAEVVLTVFKKCFLEIAVTKYTLTFHPGEVGDDKTVDRKGQKGCYLRLVFATSKPSIEVVHALGSRATTALASKVSMLENLEKVLDFLGIIELGSDAAQLNPIAQAVVPIVSRTLAKFREVASCHQQFIDIMKDLVLILPVMELALRRLQDVECRNIVEHYIAFVKETSESIISYASETDTEMVIRNWYKSKKDEVAKLKDRSSQLKQNLDLAVAFDVQNRAQHLQNTASAIQRKQIESAEESILKRVKPPKLSYFDPNRCCLQGSRSFVINAVTSFALSNDVSGRLYWLYGIAGSGKSSVAASVANTLHNRKRLSGAFFCKRDVAELRNPVYLLHALAYSIAEVYEAYKNIVMQVLTDDKRIEDHVFSLQFDALLKEPLLRLSQNRQLAPPEESIVFVIDALDECDDCRSISLFLSQIVQLAPYIRFIVTSRPLPEIGRGLKQVERHMIAYDLFTRDAHQDIQSFIRFQFSSGGPLSDIESYVNDDQIEKLAQKSSGLFIWISTVLLYVSRLLFGKYAALVDVLSSDDASGPEAQLDALYLQVLETVTGSSPSNRDTVKFILALIFVTSKNQSLPSAALHVFITRAGLRVSTQEFESFLRQMGSVLMTDTQTGAVRVCHPSFLDFIGSRSRSNEFWTRTEDVDAVMAKISFEVMEAGLRFNICGLESAYLRNDEVPDLGERIFRHVPQELQYSCMYWIKHLSQGGDACKKGMQSVVQRFLSERKALYWIEVLSLICELKAANAALVKLRFMYKDNPALRDTAIDYHTFVTYLHKPMQISTPHIYTSALLWTPSSSSISTKLYDQPLVLNGRAKEWSASLQVIACHEGVPCAVYSPDGSRIVSGLDSGLIEVRDALSGALISAPLTGHTDWVWSVAFSPDGSRIVSGSYDKTIRIWDALSGVLIGSPLEGHTESVWSVAYSPDGLRIVSGSWDKTIRIWDALSGAPIGSPLEGHTHSVNSVAYSPDGLRIVSGSHDKTIRIWDALSGASIGSPLERHTEVVRSVAYSPDGSRIASGSYDKTIRIWDALSGAPVGSPLEGHTKLVRSVAYSPDGSRIASGSDDKTIRIWDALSGARIGSPLERHTKGVRSVAYSPDGSRIASGSDDYTIRIWDALNCAAVGLPLEGHMARVNSVAYSPDGSRIVSGSYDNTIRIWDALNGAPIVARFMRRMEEVNSVAYSPDGSCIVFGLYDKTIRIWDALNRIFIGSPLVGHTSDVNSVAYSPDGSRLVSGSSDSTIRIWDALSGAPVGLPLLGHTGWVMSVAYSPDGSRIVSGSWDETIRIWDALSGAPIGSPLMGHTSYVYSVAYSPDGSRIASGSSDKTIRIWDALSCAPIGSPFMGHNSYVYSVAYSPDGSRIVSGSWDNTIRIWDALSGVPIGSPLEGHSEGVRSVAYSSNGSRIVSGSYDETIRIWDARPDAHIPVCISKDGWVRTEDGGLLLWVPRESRHGVRDTSLFSIPHRALGHPVKIDWEGLRSAWGRLNDEHSVHLT